MSMQNFQRTYTLKAGKMGETGMFIGNTESATQNVLRVNFDIEKADVESSNTGKVKIWNLSDTNLKVLEQKDCAVELKAGYAMNMPIVLVGTVASVITSKDGADRCTELEVADGMVQTRDTYVSLSLNGIVKSKDIYDELARQLGLAIVYAPDLVYKDIPNGFSFAGKAKDALSSITTFNGHQWTIQNEVIQVTLPGRPISTQGYLLNASTGLINIPKRVTISTDNDSKIGWEVDYLLNAAIGVNDYIKVESKYVNGYFRVYKVTFKGDSHASDWLCTAQILEVASNGGDGA